MSKSTPPLELQLQERYAQLVRWVGRLRNISGSYARSRFGGTRQRVGERRGAGGARRAGSRGSRPHPRGARANRGRALRYLLRVRQANRRTATCGGTDCCHVRGAARRSPEGRSSNLGHLRDCPQSWFAAGQVSALARPPWGPARSPAHDACNSLCRNQLHQNSAPTTASGPEITSIQSMWPFAINA